MALFPFSLEPASGREMLPERGIVVSYETIRRRAIKLGADYVRRLKRKAPSRHDIWHLDEVVVRLVATKNLKRWRSAVWHISISLPARESTSNA
jgi:putative transposase